MTPGSEAARLEALLRYRILDTPPEQVFDDLVDLAATVCYTPVAAIALVAEDRAWLKAKRGVDFTEFPRDSSLAAEALEHSDVFVVRDAGAHEQYRESSVVLAGFRFFAGMPLISPEGHAIGTVCVLDVRPRDLSGDQKDALRAIARQAMSQLELRRVSDAESFARLRFRALVEQLPGGVYTEDFGAVSGSYFSPPIEKISGYSAQEWMSDPNFFSQVLHPTIANACSVPSQTRMRATRRSGSSTASSRRAGRWSGFRMTARLRETTTGSRSTTRGSWPTRLLVRRTSSTCSSSAHRPSSASAHRTTGSAASTA